MFKRKIVAFFSNKPKKINNCYVSKPKKNLFWFFVFLITLLFILAISSFTDDWQDFFLNFSNIGKLTKEFLNWKLKEWSDPSSGLRGFSFLNLAFNAIWNTILLVFAGTVVGICFAIPLALFSSNNIIRNRFINIFCKSILNILRSIPSFVYAIIFFYIFGYSSLTATMAVLIFTFAVSSKMMFEKIENVNMSSYNSLLAIGTSRIKAFNAAIFPQIKFEILSILFYCLEINLKYVAVISVVSKIGIGGLIEEYKGEWNRVGFLLFLLIITILTIELIIVFLKKYVFFDKDYLLTDKQTKAILKRAKKRVNKNNIQFYLDEVILKDWYQKYNQLKENYKAKQISRDDYKIEYKKLLLEKNKLIKDFKNQYKENIKNDYLNLVNVKKRYGNQYKKWFVNDEFAGFCRIDKVYLKKFNIGVINLKNKILRQARIEIDQANKELLNKLTIETVSQNKPYYYWKRIILFLVIFGFFVFSLTKVNFYLQSKEMIESLGQYIKRMFHINWASILHETEKTEFSVVYLLYETLLIAVCGTVIGFLISLIFAILGSRNIVNKYVALFFATLTTIIRPIPKYIYALFFVVVVGIGPVNGILTIAAGTVGMLSKYIRELFNNVNQKSINNAKGLGFNQFQVFRYYILYQTYAELVAWFFYRLEINYKDVIGLGIVGAGNLGLSLNGYFEAGYFEEFGALLLGIILSSLLLEYISVFLKNKMLHNTNSRWYEKISKYIRNKKIVKYQINAYLLNIDYTNMSYEQLKLLWIDTNIEIKENAKKIKKENKEITDTYYLAYCQKYNLNFDGSKKIINEFEKKFKMKKLNF